MATPTPSPSFRNIYAPQPLPTNAPDNPTIFLAGSIDLGTAIDWQAALTNSLCHLPITILNPRRPDWDSSWKQDPSFPPFYEQVTWELDSQERCDIIAMYLSAESKAPISLLELGLFARSGRMLVACPEGFYRRGNVQIVCQRLGIELLGSLEELVQAVERKVSKK